MDHKFTIIIPYHAEQETMHFIKRQLNYYACNKNPFFVIVALSGEGRLKNELKKFIENLKDKKISLFIVPEKDITNVEAYMQKIRDVLKLVVTPYTVINGADDLLLIEEVYKGSEILQKYTNISGVKGNTIYYYCDSGKFLVSKDLSIINECPMKRLKLAIMDRDSIFYVIRRTKDLLKEHEEILYLTKESKIVGNSLYHIEHFKALSMSILGDVFVMDVPWRLQSSHKNNHTSHTPASFRRVELGIVSREMYDWFKGENDNLHGLTYIHYKILWILHQIRGCHISFKQLVYNTLYRKCSLKSSVCIFMYCVLHKLYIILQKLLPKQFFGETPKAFDIGEDFFESKQYVGLKAQYFSKKDIILHNDKYLNNVKSGLK